MIDKLNEYKITSRDGSFINVECNTKIINTLVRKINELVDVVNQLVMDVGYDGNHIADTSKKVDPYAEQRKCICKLCWFWNDDKADKVIGILTGVFDEENKPFERNIGQILYKHCEPVKPDDDIIYKGGNNE